LFFSYAQGSESMACTVHGVTGSQPRRSCGRPGPRTRGHVGWSEIDRTGAPVRAPVNLTAPSVCLNQRMKETGWWEITEWREWLIFIQSTIIRLSMREENIGKRNLLPLHKKGIHN
jgi:hypothetical protein